MCVLWCCADDEPERGRNAPVQARGTEDAAAHPVALLRVQGHMGLGYPVPDVLHGHHGAVQRGVQEQDQRGRVAAGGRLHRGRHILHRHRAQLPHHFRRARWRGGVRPKSHPHELPPVVVRHRPAVVFAVRRFQCFRSRRRGKLFLRTVKPLDMISHRSTSELKYRGFTDSTEISSFKNGYKNINLLYQQLLTILTCNYQD